MRRFRWWTVTWLPWRRRNPSGQLPTSMWHLLKLTLFFFFCHSHAEIVTLRINVRRLFLVGQICNPSPGEKLQQRGHFPATTPHFVWTHLNILGCWSFAHIFCYGQEINRQRWMQKIERDTISFVSIYSEQIFSWFFLTLSMQSIFNLVWLVFWWDLRNHHIASWAFLKNNSSGL